MTDPHGLEFAARIGIDWADQKHDVCLLPADATEPERFTLKHTPEALVDWIADLRQRFGGRPVAIALETSRGPLVHALLEHEFVVLFPVNPRSLARFREALSPSGAKDDGPDAELLLDLLVKHSDRLRPWRPDDEATRTLRRLSEHRRGSVDLRTRLTQQLRAALKEYFPQAISWVGEELESPMACDFLLEWPTLQAVQRVRPNTLRKFYHAHNCRSAELIERRIQEIRQAQPLTTDPAILHSSVLLVQTLARQLKALHPSIRRFDDEIKKHFEAHEDAAIFRSFPGSGKALGPRLLSLFGSERDRFESAKEIQLISGIAPVTVRSGKSCWVHWRWAAPNFQRQSIHEFAEHSIRSSRWARAFYDMQRERGKKHQVAVRALAFKWLRIMWRCWLEKQPYDEAKHVRNLIQRGSPLAARLAAAG